MVEKLTREQKEELLMLLAEKDRRERRKGFPLLFPDDGPYRRELYPKHIEFFKLGKDLRERCFLAGNRVGKTVSGGVETAAHLTGRYQDWWQGRRFKKHVKALVAGDTISTTRDIMQEKLLGPVGDFGTGLIPGDSILDHSMRGAVPGAVDWVRVKHASGGISTLYFRSYDQGRKIFQGSELDVVWLDEEVPEDVYSEALVRTMTTGGIVMLTFTPLMGLTPLVVSFLPEGKLPDETTVNGSRAIVQCSWDEVPHLTEKDKSELLASIPPHQREARSKGVPSLGSGAIYPVAEEDVITDPFQIPAYWPRVYGMDVGWKRTAAVWGALDRETDTVYLYSEHYRGQAEPSVHVSGIKARGLWIPGVIDPASAGKGQRDGKRLIDDYEALGLDLTPAENAVESGIHAVYERLSTGRLKVFSTLKSWLAEYRLYRRDEKGRIVKENDHLMDATRYLMMSGLDIAKTDAPKKYSATLPVADSVVGY
jgi:phage terminase large subunit-like protein